jgi:hypothetical protein
MLQKTWTGYVSSESEVPAVLDGAAEAQRDLDSRLVVPAEQMWESTAATNSSMLVDSQFRE